jgi:hypothetical protein
VDVRADFLDDETPLGAARKDRDEGERNESDEVLLRAFEDGVQQWVTARPGKGPFDHQVDAGGDRLSVPAAGSQLDAAP